MPNWILDIIEDCENDFDLNDYRVSDEPILSRAEIHKANGTGKDIIRVFKDQRGHEIKLSNFEYSLIEKSNQIMYYEGHDIKALVIFNSKEVEGIIFNNLKEEK